ncbi:hypothetical protein ACJMK2_004930 [Sinanodonta woodiana]|uniref:ELMO domain-containing protein n=1 Tax=Sinanodonta woodiana TaxID=1069815 RepID=A0ABD3VP70_SINWO
MSSSCTTMEYRSDSSGPSTPRDGLSIDSITFDEGYEKQDPVFEIIFEHTTEETDSNVPINTSNNQSQGRELSVLMCSEEKGDNVAFKETDEFVSAAETRTKQNEYNNHDKIVKEIHEIDGTSNVSFIIPDDRLGVDLLSAVPHTEKPINQQNNAKNGSPNITWACTEINTNIDGTKQTVSMGPSSTEEGKKYLYNLPDNAEGDTAAPDEVDVSGISLEEILQRKPKDESESDSEFDFELPSPKTKTATATTSLVTSSVTSPVTSVTPSVGSSPAAATTSISTRTMIANKACTVPSVTETAEKSNIGLQQLIPEGSKDVRTGSQSFKPVAVIKPTTSTVQSHGMTPEDRGLVSAKMQWESVTTIQAGFADKNKVKGPEPVMATATPFVSVPELVQHLQSQDFTRVKPSIRTLTERKGLAAFIHAVFGPPKLHRDLIQERDFLFCVAATTFANDDRLHVRTLQSVYRCLTGSKFDCPRTGGHWEEIGFQGTDPATDLRGCGLLGLVNLLYFLTDRKCRSIAHDVYKLSLHPTQNFPFCVMGINITRIALQTLREEGLNRECNKSKSVLNTVNDFYVGTYLHMYEIWKGQSRTISDSGHVLREVEIFAKKNPKLVIKNIESYIEKKKSPKLAPDSPPEQGGQNFFNVCDDR